MCIDIQNCSEVCLETYRFSCNHYGPLTTTVNIEWFMHAEMADMHLVYGFVNGNGTSSLQRWCEISSESHLRESMNRPRWPGHPDHMTSPVWISSSGGTWNSWCMKPLWKQKTSSLELQSLLVPLRICKESSNWHDNEWSTMYFMYTDQWSRVRTVPVTPLLKLAC